MNGKPLDFSFKNIADLAGKRNENEKRERKREKYETFWTILKWFLELKSIESRSGKRKPIVTENQVVVEEDKKFGGKDNMHFNNERSC